jgi:hypothetical protein
VGVQCEEMRLTVGIEKHSTICFTFSSALSNWKMYLFGQDIHIQKYLYIKQLALPPKRVSKKMKDILVEKPRYMTKKQINCD